MHPTAPGGSSSSFHQTTSMMLSSTSLRALLLCFFSIDAHNASNPYYPGFHTRPLRNWNNDPNGLFYDANTKLFHFFCQHVPMPHWSFKMQWSHAVSTDMVRWTHLPVALHPDTPYDESGVFSGSATIVDGIPVLSYSVENQKIMAVAVPANER